MSLLEAIILGIVQGLTEFLPVSSSGHLALFKKILEVNPPGITFDVFLHLGTLIPVLIIFRKDIIKLLKKPFQKYVYLLIVATIPAVIAALTLSDSIDVLFEGGILLGVGFIITGLFLLYADFVPKGMKTDKDISYFDALIIGIIQAVAICPAISRSGSTISTSLFRGLNKEAAARFSFLLSIPAIVGAAVLQVKDIISTKTVISSSDLIPYIGGFIAAALTGYLAITLMLSLIKKSRLRYFAYYVFVLAAVVFADVLVFHVFL